MQILIQFSQQFYDTIDFVIFNHNVECKKHRYFFRICIILTNK